MNSYLRLPAFILLLLLTMTMAALLACENGPTTSDQTDDGAVERSTGQTSTVTPEGAATDSAQTSEPVTPAQQGGASGEGTQKEDSTAGSSPTPEGPPCPERTASVAAPLAPSQTSAETDKEALLALFEATDGESWDQSGTWGGRAPIGDWEGVTVDDAGRVTSLQLSELAGRLPPEMGNLTSLRTLDISGSRLADGLPPELGNLVDLTNLRIRGSNVPGGLPPEFGNLTSLGELDLSGIALCGEIPPELGNLASLRELDLAGNRLVGEIPQELASLANLWRLDLSGNALGGEIPPAVGGLASLLVLHLGGNELTGDLPLELFSLAGLQELHLQDNQLTGELPPQLGELSYLESLDLSNNRLTGELPKELDELAFVLQELRLGGNRIGGCMSQLLGDYVFPNSEVTVCTPEDHPGDTEALVALYNAWGQPSLENWLSREPIRDWQGVSIDADGRVAALNLQRAGLGGTLPVQRGGLGGTLPGEVGNLTGLRLLDLEGNALTGELPEELGNLTSLEILDISGTSLTIKDGACAPNVNSLSLGISHLAPPGELCVTGEKFVSVSVGGQVGGGGPVASACAMKTDGSVVCWRSIEAHRYMLSEGYSYSPPPEGGFVSVSSGGSHSCGVRRNGSVACWGLNTEGQATPPQGRFISVSVGPWDSCGVKTDGSGVCWGRGADSPLPDRKFASVSVGAWDTCWLNPDGSIVDCGFYRPSGDFASVSIGGSVYCGVKTDSSIHCWYGDEDLPTDQLTGEFVSVSVGNAGVRQEVVCGLRQEGSVVCGHVNLLEQQPALRGEGRLAGEFVSVGTGGTYICQVRSNGAVVCWSNSNYSEQWGEWGL